MKKVEQHEVIYFSRYLEKVQPYFLERLLGLLSRYDVEVGFLEGVEEIWCKDWMPIQVDVYSYVKFIYDPQYLKGLGESPKPDVEMVCDQLEIIPDKVDLILEGSNIVRYGNHVICTDKVIKENNRYSKEEIVALLKESLKVSELTIIPSDPHDFLGLADSMVRFKDAGTVYINDYSQFFPEFQAEFEEVLKLAGLELIRLPYMPDLRKDNEGLWTAVGNYINFLEIDDLIIVPTFGLDIPDRFTYDLFKKMNPNKHVEVLGALDIALMGGVLNAVSWSKRC